MRENSRSRGGTAQRRRGAGRSARLWGQIARRIRARRPPRTSAPLRCSSARMAFLFQSSVGVEDHAMTQALPDLPLVAIYADESCLGNGREGENPGGAGGLVEYTNRAGELTRWDYWSSSPA